MYPNGLVSNVNIFLSLGKYLTELECDLNTHDIAIPCPRRHSANSDEHFLFLLISPLDTQKNGNSMARIERLYHLNGGRNVGIVFLLRENTPSNNGSTEFMKLQARYCPSYYLNNKKLLITTAVFFMTSKYLRFH